MRRAGTFPSAIDTHAADAGSDQRGARIGSAAEQQSVIHNKNMKNILDRLISQLDTLIPFIATSYNDVFKLLQKEKAALKFLGSGKVKDLYEYDEDSLLFKFSDRVSAYDVKFNEDIPKKGNVLCRFAEFWFDELGVPNHFIKRNSNTEIIVKIQSFQSIIF